MAMIKIKNHTLMALVAAMMVASYDLPALGEMPQTDVDFINQISGTDAEKINALEIYYDLHVSELEVQMITEQNTGAFLGGRRAEREGDAVEAKRLLKMYEDTKAAKEKEANKNRQIRKKLSSIYKIEFAESLVMAPEAPETISAISSVAPKNMKTDVAKAWANVQAAKKSWKIARINLLEGQEKYSARVKGVRIGDLMRSVTAAEILLARAAGDMRLVVARIAIATSQPLAKTLSGL
ncbi:MAG: hypothetical protein KAI27_01305 [Rhodospirillaceae bacterium]|nr:hypothetical protein [Rhodospirillaceae bacterium]